MFAITTHQTTNFVASFFAPDTASINNMIEYSQLGAANSSGLFMVTTGILIVVLLIGAFFAFLKVNKLQSELDKQKKALADEQSKATQATSSLKQMETNANQAFEQSQKAVSVAENANQAKGTFLATMSHEIRTPLNCILGLSEVLMSTDPNEEQKDYLESIRSSVNALLGIIGNVLDFSKIESGKLELQSERFSMSEMISEMDRLFQFAARDKGIDFQCSMESEVPLQIICDRNHLRQILINLIGNAIKFTEKGSIELQVKRDRLPPEKSPTPGKIFYGVTIEVADTGMGIPADRHEELFEPFHQLIGTETRKYEGTGLGLAICKRIVDAMGGEITVRDNSPQGSIFKVYLILEGFSIKKPTQPPIEQLTSRGLYKHALGQSFYSHKILVADDNPLNCKVMKAMMEKMGHNADFVNNGLDAVHYLQKHKVDMVFMDIMMPVLDGIEATQKIRAGEAGEENKDVPIIALTAFALTSDREKFLSCGMDFYLTKPVEPEFLRELLTKLARKSGKDQ